MFEGGGEHRKKKKSERQIYSLQRAASANCDIKEREDGEEEEEEKVRGEGGDERRTEGRS